MASNVGHRRLGQPDQGGRPDLRDAPRRHRAAGHLPAHRRRDQRHADALVPRHAQGAARRRPGTSSPTCSTWPTAAATGAIPDSGILEDGLLKTLPGREARGPVARTGGHAARRGKTAVAPASGRPAPRRRGSLRARRRFEAHVTPESIKTTKGFRCQRTSRPSSQELEALKSQVERLENEIAAARSGPGLAGDGLLRGLLRDGRLPAGQHRGDRQPAVQRDRGARWPARARWS